MKTNIEPGCPCMVTDPDNYGVSVVAIKSITGFCRSKESGHLVGEDRGSVLWEIDRLILWTESDDGLNPETMEPYCPERYLMRIDGHTEDKQTETVKEEVDE